MIRMKEYCKQLNTFRVCENNLEQIKTFMNYVQCAILLLKIKGNPIKLLADEEEVWEIMIRSKTSDQDIHPLPRLHIAP